PPFHDCVEPGSLRVDPQKPQQGSEKGGPNHAANPLADTQQSSDLDPPIKHMDNPPGKQRWEAQTECRSDNMGKPRQGAFKPFAICHENDDHYPHKADRVPSKPTGCE